MATDNNEKEYLGIDDTVIPFEMFRGVYSDEGIVIGRDYYGDGKQFMYDSKHNGFRVLGLGVGEYVTKEEIDTDEWLIIGNVLTEYSTTGYPTLTKTQLQYRDLEIRLQALYQLGKIGLLSIKEKIYNDKGEYMIFKAEFDTERGDTLLDKFRNHASFVFRDELLLTNPWEREMIVSANEETSNKLQNEIINSFAKDNLIFGKIEFVIYEDYVGDVIFVKKRIK